MVANRGGQSCASRPIPVVANEGGKTAVSSVIRVVATDEDTADITVQLQPPSQNARIELIGRSRQGKKRKTWYWRWRWQMKDEDGLPMFTASGGYKRGSRYGGKLKNRREGEQFKARARQAGRD